MAHESSIQALRALGFSGMESEIYTFLLQESPATGYRIAQALGKPAANVYKAIEALQGKEAVLVDEGAARLYRAIPFEELLGRLDRDFQERRAQAARALSELRRAPEDDRVYQLQSREQLLERARSMLARAQRLALLDAFPDPLEALRPDIEAAAARGVQVTLKVFLPTEVKGAETILNPRGKDVMDRYPGQWLILLVDGAEMLIGSLEPDRKGIHMAIWSSSVTFSWILHASFAAEIMLCTLLNHIGSGASLDEIQAAVAPYIRSGASLSTESPGLVGALARNGAAFSLSLPGYLILRARFDPPEAETERREI